MHRDVVSVFRKNGHYKLSLIHSFVAEKRKNEKWKTDKKTLIRVKRESVSNLYDQSGQLTTWINSAIHIHVSDHLSNSSINETHTFSIGGHLIKFTALHSGPLYRSPPSIPLTFQTYQIQHSLLPFAKIRESNPYPWSQASFTILIALPIKAIKNRFTSYYIFCCAAVTHSLSN